MHDVAGNAGVLRGVHVGRVLRRRIDSAICGKAACQSFVGAGTLILEEFVGYSHFNVVGFAGEYFEGFVLRFPTEARDHSVISIAVDLAGNAERLFLPRVCLHVRVDSFFWNVFDQAGAKGRSRNAVDDVVQSQMLSEIWLLDIAIARVAATRNDEEIVDTAIGRAAKARPVRIEKKFEACFADRAVGRDEGRKSVLGAIQAINQSFGIRADVGEDSSTRACPADGGL